MTILDDKQLEYNSRIKNSVSSVVHVNNSTN